MTLQELIESALYLRYRLLQEPEHLGAVCGHLGRCATLVGWVHHAHHTPDGVERGPATPHRVLECAAFEQELHEHRTQNSGSVVQRCGPPAPHGAHVRPAIEQQPRDLELANCGSIPSDHIRLSGCCSGRTGARPNPAILPRCERDASRGLPGL
jgi:hypothetical protein